MVLSTPPSSFDPLAYATPQVAPPVGATPPASAAPPAGDAPDPLPEDEDLPPVLGYITERVQEAIDYIRKMIDIGQLTQVEIMAQLIRLQESSDIVADFAATKAEIPRQTSSVSLLPDSFVTREVQRGQKAENYERTSKQRPKQRRRRSLR